MNTKAMITSGPVVARENSSTTLYCKLAVLDASYRRRWSRFFATLCMGVAAFGTIPTARSVAMVTAV